MCSKISRRFNVLFHLSLKFMSQASMEDWRRPESIQHHVGIFLRIFCFHINYTQDDLNLPMQSICYEYH